MSPTEYQELRELVERGFAAMERRFGGIDGRLDGIDGRLDGIDGRLDAHDRQFALIGAELLAIRGAIGRLDDRIESVRRENAEHFESLWAHYERLQQEYVMARGALRRYEGRHDEERERREELERLVADLATRVTDLESRVAALEETQPRR